MKIHLFLCTLLSGLVVGCSSTAPIENTETPSPPISTTNLAGDETMLHALKQAVYLSLQEQPLYQYAFYDLNQDGIQDAVVMLKGANWCGSGGCTVLVFQGMSREKFQPHSKMTVTDVPIVVLNSKTQGWSDLSVYSRGSGQVILKFNGRSYPSNPSLEPKYTGNLQHNGNRVLIQ
ncbi:hypothetical protein ACNAUY_03500 [Acinetobacter tibetensis]|uniref:hypothetical protein n=1 Tax=Acinetobacter tibetensis TaxID=2943497 RepID=UPI003A4DEF24